MKTRRLVKPGLWLVATGCLYSAVTLWAQSPDVKRGNSSPKNPETSVSKIEDSKRVPLEVARDRAKVMHDIYEVTLDVMHHRYFHRDTAVVPARALEDVFSEIKRQSHVEARWISVNLKAMSIDHEPISDFEKKAAKEISDGKLELDVVEDGYYRRAGAIPLSAGCVSCHAGLFREATRTPKYAALIISVPVLSEPEKQ